MEFNPFEWNSSHWAIFGFIIVLKVLHNGWKTYNHPSCVLCRQAVNMGWLHSRFIKTDGYNNTCLKRDGMESMISFVGGNVYMITPNCATPFKDFVDVEDWIATLNEPQLNEKTNMTNEVEREIAQIADTLETKYDCFPRNVGEIPDFPRSNFKDLLLAFETGELLLQRFAYELLNAVFDILLTLRINT